MLRYIGFGPPKPCRYCHGRKGGCTSCNGTGIEGNPGCCILICTGSVIFWCLVAYLALRK